MAGVIERNVEALIQRREQERAATGRQDKVADAISRFAGSMKFVYLHLVLYGGWILVNIGWLPILPRFDSSFVILAMAASVEAIFISTFVMISQNRMAKVADQRADLDLQISLLAEHEITRLVTLVTEVAERMALPSARDPELRELAKDVAPGTSSTGWRKRSAGWIRPPADRGVAPTASGRELPPMRRRRRTATEALPTERRSTDRRARLHPR